MTDVVAKPETVTRIMDSALELFYTHGYHGTSVRDVTVACELTPGALYNHFDSKDALLFAVIERGQAQLDADISAALGDGSPTERLSQLTHAATLFNATSNHLARVANEEYRYLDEPHRGQIIAIRRAVRERFEHVIEEGRACGDFDPPVMDGQDPVRHAAMAILNLVVGVARWFDPTGKLTGEQVAEHHARLALRMVGAKTT